VLARVLTVEHKGRVVIVALPLVTLAVKLIKPLQRWEPFLRRSRHLVVSVKAPLANELCAVPPTAQDVCHSD